MAREEEYDPFASFITLCQPLFPHDHKLRDCPLRFESEASPPVVPDSDLEQTPLTYNQSLVNGILMVSPPEAGSDEESSSMNKITPLQNDEFHTPPEHHNRRSSSSSQEFLSQREKPVAEAVSDEYIQQTACVDEGIQLEGGENLGVQVTQELKGSDGALGTQCSENVIHVDRVVGFEAKLKRYMALRDELGEHISKKFRVSKEKRDCDTLFPSETGIDDQVHCTEGLVFNKGKATEHVGSSTKDFGGICANGGLSVKAGPKSQYVSFDAGPEEKKKGKAVVEEDRVLPCSGDSLDFAPGKLIGSLKDVKNKGKSVTYIDLTAMDSDDNCGISIEERLNKKAVEEDSVEPCSVYNLDSAPGKTIGRNKDSKNDCNVVEKKRVDDSMGRTEVTCEPRNLKVNKKRSWKELMEACEALFKKMDLSLEDVDFLETAKKRGLTFP